MRTILALLTALAVLCYSNKALSSCHTYTVAVIDTGFGYGFKPNAKLCKYGHKNFSNDRSTFITDGGFAVPKDVNSHGTNVVGIIDSYARKSKVDYCIVIIKYYTEKQTSKENADASAKAIQYANDIKADFINYSGGGVASDERERLAVKVFLDRGGVFIAAAGNERSDLDLPENGFYPAMADRRVIVVGNVDIFGKRARTSNYGGFVKRWEVGENVSALGITLSGTSQATAVATGKILSESHNKCDIGF